MTLIRFKKEAGAKLPYGFDYAAWLESAALSTSSWEADSADLTLSTPSIAGDTALVWIEGGSEGELYVITNTVTTNDGRTEQRSFELLIGKRSAD